MMQMVAGVAFQHQPFPRDPLPAAPSGASARAIIPSPVADTLRRPDRSCSFIIYNAYRSDTDKIMISDKDMHYSPGFGPPTAENTGTKAKSPGKRNTHNHMNDNCVTARRPRDGANRGRSFRSGHGTALPHQYPLRCQPAHFTSSQPRRHRAYQEHPAYPVLKGPSEPEPRSGTKPRDNRHCIPILF